MYGRIRWAHNFIVIGSIAMLVGAIDPLEGSVVILIGSGMITFGIFYGQERRNIINYWVLTFILITFGVIAMFVLSAMGGIGGTSGNSIWWGLFILPYPIGWIMGIVNLVNRFIGWIRHRKMPPDE